MKLITAPDTGLARGAAALARMIEPPFLVRHSERTFRFGAHLLTAARRTFDSELLYVASMLHDIALGTELDDNVTPFHFKGASVAAKYVLDAKRSDVDASLIFDAVALHMDLIAADDVRPEVAGVHLGAAADVIGLRLDQIAPELLEEVLAASPRSGMKQSFIEVFGVEAKEKPYSRAAQLVEGFGFLDLIDASPFDE
jgi:hypothetical protein